MIAERFTPAALRFGVGRAVVRRARRVTTLAISLLAVFAASAQAHIVTATATCGSVTFDWSKFSSHGTGNGGLNKPEWVTVFKPAGGSTVTTHGVASFAGSSYSLTVAIPSGNGAVTASSSWSWHQTRDGNSNSGSTNLTIADCPVAPVEPLPPPPPTTSAPATTSAVATPPLSVAPPVVATPASPTTHPTVAPTVCVRSHVAVRGVAETVRNSVSAYVPARGVKGVTFYLDRRKLVTLSKPSHRRFSIRIDARALSLGVHRLTAKVTMLGSSCGTTEVAGTFTRVRPASLPPRFTG